MPTKTAKKKFSVMTARKKFGIRIENIVASAALGVEVPLDKAVSKME